MSNVHYQTLTVNVMTGTTNWQKPQQSTEDAVEHAYKRTRKLSDFFIYEIHPTDQNFPRAIKLVKIVRYNH